MYWLCELSESHQRNEVKVKALFVGSAAKRSNHPRASGFKLQPAFIEV
jgi:hypothetical protein